MSVKLHLEGGGGLYGETDIITCIYFNQNYKLKDENKKFIMNKNRYIFILFFSYSDVNVLFILIDKYNFRKSKFKKK